MKHGLKTFYLLLLSACLFLLYDNRLQSEDGVRLSGTPITGQGVPAQIAVPIPGSTSIQENAATPTEQFKKPLFSPAVKKESISAPNNATAPNSPITPNNPITSNSPVTPNNTMPQGSAPSLKSELPENPTVESFLENTDFLTSQKGILDSLKVFLGLTILSLVPAIFLMTTSFVRIVTVLSLLRQALGTGQIPPNQVLTALAVFLTLMIMTPAWTNVYDNALYPYSQNKITAGQALEKGELPIRTFLWKQIEKTGNTDTIWLFMKYVPNAEVPQYYEDIPWRVLLPAFMLSELKTAFLIGFQVFLPFVIIDMVVAAVMISMGMMMLPPMMVSLPFKILLFVLMDGWTLVAKMLLDSFVLLGG